MFKNALLSGYQVRTCYQMILFSQPLNKNSEITIVKV